MNQAAAAALSKSTSKSMSEKEKIPTSIEHFSSDVTAALLALIAHCDAKNLLTVSERTLLLETSDYLGIQKSVDREEEEEVNVKKRSLDNTHVQLLFTVYFRKLANETGHRLTVLSVLQRIALGSRQQAQHILDEEQFRGEFLPRVKDLVSPDLRLASLQLLSNICAHSGLSEQTLASSQTQDAICRDLAEFLLSSGADDMEALVHEASVSLFYNLVPAYHLESRLSEANALAIGCALLERLPKFKSSPRTTYRMLALLRSCLVRSAEVAELAQSMDFNLSAYKGQDERRIFEQKQPGVSNYEAQQSEIVSVEKTDSFEAIVSKIDELIHPEVSAEAGETE